MADVYLERVQQLLADISYLDVSTQIDVSKSGYPVSRGASYDIFKGVLNQDGAAFAVAVRCMRSSLIEEDESAIKVALSYSP